MTPTLTPFATAATTTTMIPACITATPATTPPNGADSLVLLPGVGTFIGFAAGVAVGTVVAWFVDDVLGWAKDELLEWMF